MSKTSKNIGEFAKTIEVNPQIQKKQLKKNRFKRIPFWVKKIKSILFFSNQNVYTLNIKISIYLQRIQERTTKNEITRTEKQELWHEDQPLIVKK